VAGARDFKLERNEGWD
jgi:hypothetical protein